LLILSANLQHWLFANQYSSLGEPPLNVIEAIPAALVFSFWSLLFFGWITVPAGALIGASAIAAIKWRKAGNSAATRR